MKALLDTHILLYWFAARSRLSTAQLEILRQATPSAPLWVSDISLWEIATLYSLRRFCQNLFDVHSSHTDDN